MNKCVNASMCLWGSAKADKNTIRVSLAAAVKGGVTAATEDTRIISNANRSLSRTAQGQLDGPQD